MRGAAYDKIPLKTRKSYKKIAPPYGMIFLAEKINREKTAGREIHMARKIVVTSGKGGVGKTTVAANLGAQLSRRGERVILCDTDFGLNNMDVVTGVENLVVYDIVDVIEGRCRAKQALIRHPDFGNLYILASNHSAPERYISPQAVKLVTKNPAQALNLQDRGVIGEGKRADLVLAHRKDNHIHIDHVWRQGKRVF